MTTEMEPVTGCSGQRSWKPVPSLHRRRDNVGGPNAARACGCISSCPRHCRAHKRSQTSLLVNPPQIAQGLEAAPKRKFAKLSMPLALAGALKMKLVAAPAVAAARTSPEANFAASRSFRQLLRCSRQAMARFVQPTQRCAPALSVRPAIVERLRLSRSLRRQSRSRSR